MAWRIVPLMVLAWGLSWSQSRQGEGGQLLARLRQATSLSNGGKHEEAMALLEQTLKSLKQMPGNRRVEAIALNNLGLVEWQLGQHAKAERDLRRAIALIDSPSKGRDPLLAPFLNNLALVYQDQNQLGRAERCERRVLAILETLEPRQRFDEATTLNALGVSLTQQGRRREGLELLERAMAVWDSLPRGVEVDKSRAQCLLNLAAVYFVIGRLDEAARGQAEAVATIGRLVAPAHPEFIKALMVQGQILAGTGDLEGAERSLGRAAALANDHLAGNAFVRGRVLARYAEVLQALGRKQEARAISNEAKAVLALADQSSLSRHTVDYSDLVRESSGH